MLNVKRLDPYIQAVNCLPGQAAKLLLRLPSSVAQNVMEIRLRAEKPIDLYTSKGHLFLDEQGQTQRQSDEYLPRISQVLLEECLLSICDYSLHTHQQDLAQGFVTLRGGHRAGICGSCVWKNGKPAGVRDISSICLRIARDFDGSANRLAMKLLSASGGLLIAGIPGSGKTTLLRALARYLADGYLGSYYRVTVVDERGELGAVSNGEAQYNLGVCCDILDNYPKGMGIEMAVRTLSPDYVFCDELGGVSDIEALRQSVCRGIRVVATVHAGTPSELMAREGIPELLATGAFSQIVFLGSCDSPGEITDVFTIHELMKYHRGEVQ